MHGCWLDAQLPPALAPWLESQLGTRVQAIRELGLRDASDEQIFGLARASSAVIITKDVDFLLMMERQGSPPRVIWLRCGNTTNKALRELFTRHASELQSWFQGEEPLLEIR